jgi:L-alanine-DL-glutamate epimerase-like enolase superfamily enzyme
MKITRVDCHVLLVPNLDPSACSSAQDDLVVEIHTDAGIVGIGESDVSPWIGRECIRARGTHCMSLGVEELLLGADPMQPESLWERLYSATKMTGRRGAMICALGAVDMALWDIRGQALGQPIWELLGGAAVPHVVPYASLLPKGHSREEQRVSLLDKVCRARELGFRAAKLEICWQGPYSHGGLQEPDEAVVAMVGEARAAVGPEMTLMVDVAYAWNDPRQALRILKRLEPYDLFFLETPLNIDDLAGHAFLHDHSPIRIAAGEWQNTHFEFLDLADRGKIDVLQPDVGRVGGFTEARKVVQLAADRGKLIVPHCWKSAIGIAASVHLAASTGCCPYVEFMPAELSESELRTSLVMEEFQQIGGTIPLPTRPGLGVSLNRDAVQRYSLE